MNINSTKLELLTAAKDLNFAKLSELSGISRQNISTIKTRGTCSAKSLVKLAAALGVDVEELMEVK